MKSIFAALLIALLPATLVGQGAPNVRAATLGWNWTYPTNLSGLQFWVKADALALNDADLIATWPDSSGNGRDAAQGVGLLQPSYRVSVLAGKPVVRFDMVADLMTTGNFGLALPVTVLIVTKWNQARVTNDTLFDGTTLSYLRAYRAATNITILGSPGSIAGNTVVTPETFHVYSFLFNSGPAQALNSFDGGYEKTGSLSSTVTPDGLVLNANGSLLTLAGQDMAEMVVYSRALSATERRKIERYLSLKWGLPLQN